MSQQQKGCPRCGCGTLDDNGGMDGHAVPHGLHFVLEGLAHANPVQMVLGAGTFVAGVFNPKKYTCVRCGHVFKA